MKLESDEYFNITTEEIDDDSVRSTITLLTKYEHTQVKNILILFWGSFIFSVSCSDFITQHSCCLMKLNCMSAAQVPTELGTTGP